MANKYINTFDNALKYKGCIHCELRSQCLGGCHFMPQINQCEKVRIRKNI